MSLNMKEVVEYIDSTTKIIEAQEKTILEKEAELGTLKKQASEIAGLFGVDSLEKVREKIASANQAVPEPESKIRTWGAAVGEQKKALAYKEAAERRLCERLGIPYRTS